MVFTLFLHRTAAMCKNSRMDEVFWKSWSSCWRQRCSQAYSMAGRFLRFFYFHFLTLFKQGLISTLWIHYTQKIVSSCIPPEGLCRALLRPYYTAKRTRKLLISNIHLLSPQKWSQFVHFNIEKVFPRRQPQICPGFLVISKIK